MPTNLATQRQMSAGEKPSNANRTLINGEYNGYLYESAKKVYFFWKKKGENTLNW
jgi:hypothetical protein